MPDKQNKENELSSNQEYIIAFLVIALFGLMYWFFMHGNDTNLNKNLVVDSSNTPVIADTKSKTTSIDNSVKIKSKKDEVQDRRDSAIALNQKKTDEAETMKLLAGSTEAEDTLRNLLLEKEQALASEIQLKQEALDKLALLESQSSDDVKESQQVSELDKQKAQKLTEELAEAKQLAEAESLKGKEIAAELEELKTSISEKETLNDSDKTRLTESLDAERSKAEELATKLADAEAMVAAERLKLNTSEQEVANLQQLKEKQASLDASKATQLLASIEDGRKTNEAERVKAEEMAKTLAEATEAERLKAESAELKLVELEKQRLEAEALNADKAAQLVASIEAERMKADKIAQRLAETKKLVEEERLKTEETALKLAELEQLKKKQEELTASNAAQLNANVESERKLAEAERVKAEQIAQKLVEATQAAEAERMKAESAVVKLAELEKQKAEEETRRIAEEKERKIAEINRLKAEQELEAIKKQKAEEEALLVALEKSELEARIKAAQEALIQQERNRLSFPLATGRSVTIDQNSFENKLKTSIIDEVTNQPLVFDRVFFASGSAALSRASIRQIEGTAGILQAYENTKVRLRGHTDNTGDSASNMELSLSRSTKIREKLVSLGIDVLRIEVEGKGALEPVSTNDNPLGRRENRRIDLLILDK